MDSTVLAYQSKNAGYDQHLLSFFYGQRHRKELQRAAQTAIDLGAFHSLINLSDVTALFTGSSLTDKSVAVPEGHYAEDNMRLTVVPNRNAIMLSIAWGVAVAEGAVVVAYGAHAGDHAQYPDCRTAFIDVFEQAMEIGNEGMGNPNLFLYTPFAWLSKAQIVEEGLKLNVRFENTWSCYKGEELSCGRCGTCVERLEAFDIVGAVDPLVYADRDYWKEAVATKAK
jgi:7-cyano-7-deazaguanine synthase